MPISPATIAAFLLVLITAALVVLTVIAFRPAFQGPIATSVQAAPGPHPRAHGRAPSDARRTSRRGAGRRTARPAAPTSTPAPAPVLPPETDAPVREAAVTPPPRPPETVVEGYYRALDAGRFEAAWAILTPAVQAAFGDFGHWRAGYADTLSSTPRDIHVSRQGGLATVAHDLLAEDRTPCGPVRQTFAIRWRLAATDAGWRATSLTAVKRSGPEPAEACAERHDAARAAGGR